MMRMMLGWRVCARRPAALIGIVAAAAQSSRQIVINFIAFPVFLGSYQ